MVYRRILLFLLLALVAGAPAWTAEPAPVALAAKWTTGQFSGDEEMEQAVLTYTNVERARLKLTPLARHDLLRTAARQHSWEMGEKKYFAHDSPVAEWRKAWHRAYYAGYWGQRIGENIIMLENARLKTTDEIARRMVELWMGSPTHRANILKPEWTLLGVGVVKVGEAYYGTQVFGAPLVELQSAAVTPVSGEMARLRLEGALARGKITVWVNNQLEQTVTPARGKWSAEIDCPRGAGEKDVMVGVNNVLAWMAKFNPDNPKEPLRAIEEDSQDVVQGCTVALAPYTGLHLTAVARVPAGEKILLARDRKALTPLTPDSNGMVAIDLLLLGRTEPYVISLAVGENVEDLLFINPAKPAPEAFLGRPE